MKKEVYEGILKYLKDVIAWSEYENHVFAVGGCCRDCLKNREIKDIDLVIDLPNGGIEFANWLYNKGKLVYEPVVYQNFGTAMFRLKEFPEIELEAVQTRKECYRDINSRDPETAFGTITDDCTRRDFTYNAIYYDISHGTFCDYNSNSLEDLDKNILRTCGDPDVIFMEDPLRILRAVRFMSRFGSTIEEKTFEGMKRNVDRLGIISRERIHDEFMKMCNERDYHQTCDAFFTLWDIGAFKYIIPSFGNFTHKDVYFYMQNLRKVLSWGHVFGLTKEGMFATILFGDDNAEQVLRDLKCPNEFIDEVMFLINTNKEFDRRLGEEIDVDCEAATTLFREYAHICGSRKRMLNMMWCGDERGLSAYYFDYDEYGDCLFDELYKSEEKFFTYELPVDGEDVMRELGIGPSKEVGDTLKKLWKFVYGNPTKDSREELLKYLNYVKSEKI